MAKQTSLVFFARLFYPHIGGVEKHVLEIGKRFAKQGYLLTVITENYQSLPITARIEGINIVRLNVGKDDWFKKFRIWKELLKNIQIIRNADIIHCHDVFFWYLPFKFIFLFKEVYTTFHGYEGNKIPDRKEYIVRKIAEKLSRGNICIGNFYQKWYGTKATFVSYGAVDRKLIEEGLNPIKPTKEAMFLGRLEEETGIIEYLVAIKDKRLKLDVFGEGSLEKKAREYVNKNKLDVKFKGFVENATDYIKDYKYLFTSRYLGILEGMALKKPVFALYNNKIKKDYLEMTAFSSYISISKDGSHLSKQLDNYLGGKSKINTAGAYEWVSDKTWENLLDIYKTLWRIS